MKGMNPMNILNTTGASAMTATVIFTHSCYSDSEATRHLRNIRRLLFMREIAKVGAFSTLALVIACIFFRVSGLAC